jgi:hypothetical protein
VETVSVALVSRICLNVVVLTRSGKTGDINNIPGLLILNAED